MTRCDRICQLGTVYIISFKQLCHSVACVTGWLRVRIVKVIAIT